MTPEFEFDPADYHLRLMIDQMEREGRSEAAIDRAVRIASSCWKRPAKMTWGHDKHPDGRNRVFDR